MKPSIKTTETHTPRAEAAPVAYLMSRFPKVTETFVLWEILALIEQGVAVEVYPLLRAGRNGTKDGASIWRKALDLLRRPRQTAAMHPEADRLVQKAHYAPFLSWPILRAQGHFLWKSPRAYLGALWALARGTWGNTNRFVGGLAIFPKAVYFARLMQADGTAHVHAHFANHPAAAAFVIHRLTGISYSFTAHGSDLHRDQHMLREKVAEAAFVATVSNYNRDFITSHCGPQFRDKIAVVHCGVDTRVFRPSETDVAHDTARPETGRPLQILAVGTLHEVKGFSHLIEACRQLEHQGIDFRCRIVGDGPDHTPLAEQIARDGLSDRVELLGTRLRDEIVSLMQTSDVLAAPSVPTKTGRREGIPVVLMEAMACGLPVVASRVSGIPELVEDERYGLLVPAGDAGALAAALVRLHREPTLGKRLGKAGREKVACDFNLHANATALRGRFFRREATSSPPPQKVPSRSQPEHRSPVDEQAVSP